MRGLTSEQLLLIADEVCTAHGETVQNFAALAAVAAMSTANFYGVRVHYSSAMMADEVADAIIMLKPLSGRNHQLAAATRRVLLHLNG